MKFNYKEVLGKDGKKHYCSIDNEFNICFCGEEISTLELNKNRYFSICSICQDCVKEFDEIEKSLKDLNK